MDTNTITATDPKGQPKPRLVRSAHIASQLDVSARTVETWAKNNLIPCVRIKGTLRFDEDAVMAALKGGDA